MKKRIVFTGGGTAGHVMPNLALISRLKDEYDCVYVGSGGMEKELCEKRGVPFFCTDAVKLRRDAFFKNIAVPFRLAACTSAAKKLLKELAPDLVFSKGGYVALPVVRAANKSGVPVIAHESDFSPGLVTKLSAKRAQKVLCAFPPCADRFKNGVYVGAPLDGGIYRAARNAVPRTKPRLLVIGGSSGAAALNEAAAEALPLLLKTFDVVHITGKNKAGAAAQKGYSSLSFCDDMPALYASVDVALSRGGANALAELIALCIPTVCVPLERASRGDQIQNADYYEKAGAIAVLRESDITPQRLCDAVCRVYSDRIKYKAAMSGLRVDGTQKICGIIRQVLNAVP